MSIASRIENMNENIKNTYNKIEKLGIDLTNVNKNLSNLPIKMLELYNDWPKVSNESSALNLSSTRKAVMEIELKSNEIVQKRTTGKNKLQNNIQATTRNGITAVLNNDGTVTVNGTATADTFFNINSTFSQLGTFILNGCPAGGNTTNAYRLYLAYYEGETYNLKNDTGSGVEFTFTENSNTPYVVIEIFNGKKVTNLTFKPMIRNSNISDSTYEPYTGGASSPSPDYPQDMYIISGDNKVKIKNKNLLIFDNEDYYWNGITSNINNNVISLNGTATTNWSNLNVDKTDKKYALPPGTYVLSTNHADNFVKIYKYVYADEHGVNQTINFAIEKNQTSGNAKTIPENATFKKAFINIDGLIAETEYDSSFSLQLELASTATTFVPSEEQVAEINLPVENLFDKDNSNIIDNLDIAETNNSYATNNNFATIYLKLPIGTYTISRGDTSRISIASSSNIPANGGTHQARTNGSNSAYTYTTQYEYLAIGIDKRSISINDFIEGLQIEKGSKVNTYTPYGTTPLEYCKIGNYKDSFIRTTGKNLFNKATIQRSKTIDGTNGNIISWTDSLSVSDFIEIDPNLSYIISGFSTAAIYSAVNYYDINKNLISTSTATISSNQRILNSIASNCRYIRFNLATVNNDSVQLESGTNITPYEPYGLNKWYLRKNINKIIFNGNEDESWEIQNNNRFCLTLPATNPLAPIKLDTAGTDSPIYSKYFISTTPNVTWSNTTGHWISLNNGSCSFTFTKKDVANTIEELRTWLSTHNCSIYYPLLTPSYILLNNTLQKQLEDIYNNLYSYENKTNIIQENNNLPFIINAKALIKNT